MLFKALIERIVPKKTVPQRRGKRRCYGPAVSREEASEYAKRARKSYGPAITVPPAKPVAERSEPVLPEPAFREPIEPRPKQKADPIVVKFDPGTSVEKRKSDAWDLTPAELFAMQSQRRNLEGMVRSALLPDMPLVEWGVPFSCAVDLKRKDGVSTVTVPMKALEKRSFLRCGVGTFWVTAGKRDDAPSVYYMVERRRVRLKGDFVEVDIPDGCSVRCYHVNGGKGTVRGIDLARQYGMLLGMIEDKKEGTRCLPLATMT